MSHMLGLAAAARPLRTGRDADAVEAARLDGVKLLASLLPPSAATPEGTSLDGDAEEEEEEEHTHDSPEQGADEGILKPSSSQANSRRPNSPPPTQKEFYNKAPSHNTGHGTGSHRKNFTTIKTQCQHVRQRYMQTHRQIHAHSTEVEGKRNF